MVRGGVVRGCLRFEAGGRLAPRCALVGNKGRGCDDGSSCLRISACAALTVRRPSAADGARGRDGSWRAVVRSGQPTASVRLAPRFALVGNTSREYDDVSSYLRIGEPLRSLPATRRLLMGREVGSVRGELGARRAVVRGGLGFEAGGRLVSADSLRAALSSAIKDEDVMEARRASE